MLDIAKNFATQCKVCPYTVLKYTIEIKNNNQAAFEQVYFEYYEKLYAYYLTKTRSRFFSEELAQEAFIKLWVYRGSLSEEIPIAAQLFRIAKTIFIDKLKKKQLEIVSIEAIHLDVGNNNDGHDVENKEFAKAVHDSIEELPPIRKKVFRLSRVDGLSHNEIAKLLSISPKSVNNHITKAIQQLKRTIPDTTLVFILFVLLKK